MIVYLSENKVTFELESGESNSVFLKIKESVKYNQILIDLRQKFPDIFKDEDWDRPEWILKLAKMVRSDKYQNYLIYKYNLKSSPDSSREELFFNHISKTWDNEESRYVYGKYFGSHEMWDGNLPYFRINARSRRFSCWTGWFRRLYKFIVKNFPDIELNIVDKRSKSVYWKEDFVDTIGIYKLRGYQSEVVKKVISTLTDTENLGHYFNAVCLDLATNTGKTPITAGIIANLAEGHKVMMPHSKQELFLKSLKDVVVDMQVDNVGIIASDSFVRSCKKFLRDIGYEGTVHYNSFMPFTMVMVPTFMSRMKKGKYDIGIVSDYDVGIFDECHIAISEQFKKLIQAAGFAVRIGMSGTPFDSKNTHRNYEVLSLYGDARYTISNEENMSKGVSLRPIVTMYKVGGKKAPVFTGKLSDPITHRQQNVYMNKRRFEVLEQVIRKYRDKQTLIYFGRADIVCGKTLYDWIKYVFPDIKVAYTDGSDKYTYEKTEQFKRNEIQFLIVNSIFMMGKNIPNIEHFINWEATDNKASIKQAAIGRSIRTHKDESNVIISDFYDSVGVYKTYSESRMKIYKDPDQGCEFNISTLYEK